MATPYFDEVQADVPRLLFQCNDAVYDGTAEHTGAYAGTVGGDHVPGQSGWIAQQGRLVPDAGASSFDCSSGGFLVGNAGGAPEPTVAAMTYEIVVKPDFAVAGEQSVWRAYGFDLSLWLSIWDDGSAIFQYRTNAGNWVRYDPVAGTFTDGEVAHVAMTVTHDGVNTTIRVYVNGIFIGTDTDAGTPNSYTYTVGGYGASGGVGHFRGQISHYAQYQHLLTDERIEAHANAALRSGRLLCCA